MRVEVVSHPSGDQLPIILDDDGLPIPMPNEYIMGRRNLAINTLIRNMRELAELYEWLGRENLDLWEKISTGKSFTEAEIRGGLVESLRRDHTKGRKVKSLAVNPRTFNQKLITTRKYFELLFDQYLGSMPFDDMRYERIRDQKKRTVSWLDSSFVSSPPVNASKQKGLTIGQAKFLTNCLDPLNTAVFGRNPAVRFRNYVSVMIMLNYGLRPGELLCLKVEDVEFGAISAIKIIRRLPDFKDKRKPRAKIKRNGRVMPIDNPTFARHLNEYIMKWRAELEEKANEESEYLILSDEGDPLSQPTLVQFFQLLRKRFPNDLPANLTAKSLRHTFSRNMEIELRSFGMLEGRREEALADLRGDSSLSSQQIYIAEEVKEQANIAMRNYHKKLLS
jgi:integrase